MRKYRAPTNWSPKFSTSNICSRLHHSAQPAHSANIQTHLSLEFSFINAKERLVQATPLPSDNLEFLTWNSWAAPNCLHFPESERVMKPFVFGRIPLCSSSKNVCRSDVTSWQSWVWACGLCCHTKYYWLSADLPFLIFKASCYISLSCVFLACWFAQADDA